MVRLVAEFMPVDSLSTSTMIAGSRPKRLPIKSVSAAATVLSPLRRLFRVLSAWPEPTLPVRKTWPAMVSSISSQGATMSSSPPTMMESVPASAPAAPPETGASNMWMPSAASSSAMATVNHGSDELMSIRTLPGSKPSARPSAPNVASRTSALAGSMVMTASHTAATAMAESSATMPLCARASAAAAFVSIS